MTDITVRPLRTARERRAFLTLPWRVYKNDPLWVPPLLPELQVLDTACVFPTAREALLNFAGALLAILLLPHLRPVPKVIRVYLFFLGLLNAVAIGDLTKLDVNFLALTAKATTVPMIRRAHRRGTKTYPWTINDPVQMSVMMSRGVDGIITDNPALARQVLELRKQLSPFGRLVVWVAGETGLLRGVDKYSTADDA